MRFVCIQLSCLLSILLLVSGCGGGSGYPETIPVTGTVTMDGKPVEGATVSFTPDGTGTPANGITDSGGNFTLTSFESGDGAVAGKYKVTITKTEDAAVSTPEVTADNPDAAYLAAEAAGQNPTGFGGAPGGDADQSAKNLLPSRYSAPDTSDLTADVSKGGDNTFQFELKP